MSTIREEASVERRRYEDKWHLDKRVNITIILTLVIQAVMFAYGYGVLNEKVNANTRSNQVLIETMPRLTKLETLVITMADTLKDIKDELRRARERDLEDRK